METQKDAFLRYEADNWFKRNKEALHSNVDDDMVIKVLNEYSAEPNRVLEIGCSAGHRLQKIASNFRNVQATGIEPSDEAILYGKKNFPSINFIKGTADDLSFLSSASFDLVVIGFVLYVVDREMLFKVIAETDRVLEDGGILMIVDFFSEKPLRNSYQHINEFNAYSYKQNYEEIFTASKLYHLLDKRSISHTNAAKYDITSNYHDKYTLVTLRKDLLAAYK